MSAGIFLIQPNNQLIEMNEQPYDTEALLQGWVADFPHLLVGQQINSVEPRKWILIAREMPLASEEDGAGRWSVDHLFLDQDGIPTIVEVKRSSDTRIRREVVGQMLDYAANAVVYWPVETLRSRFLIGCDKRQEAEDQKLLELGVNDAATFWKNVETNLQAGRVRLIFVADVIPPELQRIVEFLNQQMNPAEVLAIEVKRYVGQGKEPINAVVPRVIGQTAQAVGNKGGPSRPSKQWDEPSFLAALQEKRGETEVQVARAILEWAKSRNLRIWWGKGKIDGSFFPMFDYKGENFFTVSVWTYGRMEIQFEMMKSRPVFDDEQKRVDLLNRINTVLKTSFPPDAINRRPSIALITLNEQKKISDLLSILDDYLEKIESSF